MADSAAAAGQLWERWVPRGVVELVGAALPGGGEDALRVVRFLGAAHDAGKRHPRSPARSNRSPGSCGTPGSTCGWTRSAGRTGGSRRTGLPGSCCGRSGWGAVRPRWPGSLRWRPRPPRDASAPSGQRPTWDVRAGHHGAATTPPPSGQWSSQPQARAPTCAAPPHPHQEIKRSSVVRRGAAAFVDRRGLCIE
ncbi:HD domain-containing protein [Streptomyces alboflavus]|uniref:HD domain-containing protein n=1 Tax=Streptomyces alboflavus TaxID=67267 RepID=UPI0036AA8E5B